MPLSLIHIFRYMKNILFLLLTLVSLTTFSQNKINSSSSAKPKLVIGIVVDQMRWDYLYRYQEKYGQTGFKRLQKGYNCENTHIPYIPTYTAPGHTCIYTGSIPAMHGIVGNDWYDRSKKRKVYCTEDSSCHTVGTTGDVGQMSPRNMLTTTVTDELRLASNFQSKVIGIAIKDRSAILPAGHTGNGAYWFDGKSGKWISSSYYGDTLPAWVNVFNGQKLPEKYLAENWKPILALSQYTESTSDEEPYEKPLKKEGKATFPYMTSEMMAKNVDVIKNTPWGNTLTFDFAKASIVGERLGKGGFTDFLTLSFSSTDYIGHQFGPNSVEAEDCYIRFDKELGDFLSYLDSTLGSGNYLVFLTADHGAAHADGFNSAHQIPSGNITDEEMINAANKFLKPYFSTDTMIEAFANMQFYLKNTMAAVRDQLTISPWQNQIPSIKLVINLPNINSQTLPDVMRQPIINGYNPKRSGDVQIVYEPAVLGDRPQGTTHGSLYNYDTHIPLIWYGWGIKPGYDYSPTYMTDIAATLAALLHIQEPNGCVGKPILLMTK